MIEKNWNEFVETGLLWLVNTVLFVFGWCISVFHDGNGNVTHVAPCRTRQRGFSEAESRWGYLAVTDYLAHNLPEIIDDIVGNVKEDANKNE